MKAALKLLLLSVAYASVSKAGRQKMPDLGYQALIPRLEKNFFSLAQRRGWFCKTEGSCGLGQQKALCNSILVLLLPASPALACAHGMLRRVLGP